MRRPVTYSARFSRVRPDVAHAAAAPAAGGIRAPLGLLHARPFETGGEPALRVLDDDLAQPAEIALPHEVAGQLHHRIAGVVVGQGEHAPALPDDLAELPRLVHREGHRLVADDVEPGFEKRLGDREVEVVRSDDGHEVDAGVGRQGALALDHGRVQRVGAVGAQPQFPALLPRTGRIGRERPRHQLHVAVDARGPAVDVADERAGASSDHAHAQPSYGRRHVYSSNAASNATPDGSKSASLTYSHDSRAPCSRSMPESSHSTESGPE